FHVLDEGGRGVVPQTAVRVEEVAARHRQVLEQTLRERVEHGGGNLVAGERRIRLPGGQREAAELVADHYELVVDRRRLPLQAEALGHVSRRVAARHRYQVAEVAAAHRLGRQQ